MFELEEIVDRYLAAWNEKNVTEVLKALHPQASYYDAFWGETCSGPDLQKYLRLNIMEDTRWYRPEGKVIVTPTGMVARYTAFDHKDQAGIEPLFVGVEVFTLSAGQIMTISDFYCDPNPDDLVEIAARAEKLHGAANVAELGLSARISGRIKRRLESAAGNTQLISDTTLSVTKLADHIGCSVMHLFHVLEEELGSSFNAYIGESRARYASSLLINDDISAGDLETIAYQAGFESLQQFLDMFERTFGTSPNHYMQQFTNTVSNAN